MPSKKYTIKDFLEIKSSSSGAFSPDGKLISFLSNVTGTSQLYIIPNIGGDPKQLTFFESSLSFAIFSPTKNEILFGKDEDGDEMIQFYLLDINTGFIKEITKNRKVKHQFGAWSYDGRFTSYSSNERNKTDFDVYIMNMETGEIRCIYDSGGRCNAQGFSPSGKYLSFKKLYSLVDHDLYLCDLERDVIEHITPHSDKAEYGNPRWLPNESGFYTIANSGRDFIGLAFYSFQSKKLEYIMNPDWDIDGTSISMDGKYLAVILNENGYGKLDIYELPALKKVPNQIFPKGNIYLAKFSQDGSHIVFTIGDSRNNRDIWIWSIKENKYWSVTKSFQGVPAEVLIEPMLVHYKSFDGLNIPAFIYLPSNLENRGRLPVIVNIHGGPESQYRPDINLLLQYFVYNGYAVISPNVRGSSGYGKNYLALDDIEKRMDSVKDLASLHGYLKTLPYIDSNRAVLMGGSYGGFMTLAGLAFYPDLWVAGVSMVGISNFITFLENTASYRRLLREAEYGSLDKHRDLLYSISPINHVKNIKSPLFVIHGANDPRVPLSEAEQIVKKLKELGRKVELLVYEDEGHGLSKLKNKLDAYPKVVNFLKEVFEGL